MQAFNRNRIIVGILLLANLIALLHYTGQFSAFHSFRDFVSIIGALVFMAAQGFYLYRPTKLIPTAILLAAIASMGFHIAWEIFDETALAGLFLNLQYFIRPGSVFETLGIGDHEAFGVMLEPVVLYGFVLAGMLGLIPGVKHNFKKAKPTSSKGVYLHNPRKDKNGNALDEMRDRQHLYHIYAATPSRNVSFTAWGYAYIVFAFLAAWIPAGTLSDPTTGFFIAILVGIAFYFIVFKTIKDKRIKAHDTWFFFNTAHLVTPDNIKTDTQLDLALEDVCRFCVRPTVRADGSYIEATFTPSNSTSTALVTGLGGEMLLGTSVMPGSVGLAMGATAGAVSAATNVVGTTMALLINGLHTSTARHKLKIAEHSFVVELEMKDGKHHVIAGGLNEETATKLMNELADHVAADYKAFWADVDKRTKEQIEMYH